MSAFPSVSLSFEVMCSEASRSCKHEQTDCSQFASRIFGDTNLTLTQKKKKEVQLALSSLDNRDQNYFCFHKALAVGTLSWKHRIKGITLKINYQSDLTSSCKDIVLTFGF